MEKKKDLKLIIIVGFALFATFFGAGNLVFPPAIGIVSGAQWPIAMIGLTITGILLPILGVYSIGNAGGSLENLARPIAPWFAGAYLTFNIIFCAAGSPGKQAITAVDVGVLGLFPGIGETKFGVQICIFLYLAIVYFLANNPSKVIEKVGQYLTPILMVIMGIIVIAAFVKPIDGMQAEPPIPNVFGNAFVNGYLTGDVVAAMLIGGTFIGTLKQRMNVTNHKQLRSASFKISAIAFAGLFIIYAGLCYLGATGMKYFEADMDQTVLLISLVKKLMGNVGSAFLSVAVLLACLTTTTGLVASMAEITKNAIKKDIPNKLIILVFLIIGFFVGLLGFRMMVMYLVFPVFYFIYPMSMVLVVLGAFGRFVPNHGCWKGAIIPAVLFGIYDAINMLNALGTNIHVPVIEKIYNVMPFAAQSAAWFVPCVAGFVIGGLIVKLSGKEAYPMGNAFTE